MKKLDVQWRKASHSEAGGHCVEVSRCTATAVAIRDSTLYSRSPVLELTSSEWTALLVAIRSHS
ncbi:uncharacterized protein DUF397 [Actinomadura pelletieri DSM 43383]|uniref:Uncharacterized protein DUF397 n=1 Tax=Actinomadura pelletieri DSM 43383 TaxID=1120940 RepID=A0A495Q967_9ACTN|nr:DUF397 domain-containing protein [Actinomadura pelletieri]RKS67691.1 uncharacterized protein DUF397 [Actinomadura pelletieri DSM 43383]